MTEESDKKTIVELHAIFHGRVQGVGFRYTAEYYAAKLGLLGEVRNLPDGSVELLVQGSRSQVDQLVNMLTGNSGPGLVSAVDKNYRSPSQVFSSFGIGF